MAPIASARAGRQQRSRYCVDQGRFVRYTITNDAIFSLPNLSAFSEALLVCAVPPTIDGQRTVASSLIVVEREDARATPSTEASPLRRPLLTLRLNLQGRSEPLHVRLTHTVEIALRNLRVGTKKPEPESNRSRYLTESATLNYRHQAFARWLDERSLRPNPDDGPLDLAYRIFMATQAYRAEWDKSSGDRIISKLALRSATDCGGVAALFTGGCRANNLPARMRVGINLTPGEYRVSQASKATEVPYHVICDGYSGEAGWYPVNPGPPLDGKPHPENFGQQRAPHLAMHEDTDLWLRSLNGQFQPVAFLQSVLLHVQNPRLTLWQMSQDESWTIRKD